jgi:hypothetical protein
MGLLRQLQGISNNVVQICATWRNRLRGVGLRRQPRRYHDERDQGKELDFCFQDDFPSRLPPAPKEKGRDLLTLRNRHWYALMERFQTRPMGRVFCAIHDFKITSFVADSSRSYANLLCWSFLHSFFGTLTIETNGVRQRKD